MDLSLDIMRDEPTGIIHLSTPVIFGQAILGPVITQFLTRYPACDVAVELTDRQIDLVEETVDVVVRIGPLGGDRLVAKPLGLVYAGLYRASNTQRAAPATIQELANFPLGLLHAGFAAAPVLAMTSVDNREQSLAVKPRLVCLNPWLLKEAALASDLIVVLPNIIAERDVDAHLLERVLPGWFARRAPIHLAFTSPRSMRPAVRAFVDFAVAVIPEMLQKLQRHIE